MLTEPWDGLNGADGGCQCPSCKQLPLGTAAYWDTLLIPFKGHAVTIHMPNPAEFRDYLNRKGKDGWVTDRS